MEDVKMRAVISLVALGMILYSYSWYEEPLRDYTLANIPNLKITYGETFRVFSRAINLVSHIEIYYLAILVAFSVKCNLYKTFEGFLLLQCLIVVNEGKKMIYERPRPFMLADFGRGVIDEKCPMEYGAPSGHSLLSAGMGLYFAIEYGGT
jgi:membrane-associated phospholipid phosphatase